MQADAGALQMILRNLVENSVRHARINPVSVRLTASRPRLAAWCSNTRTTAAASMPARAPGASDGCSGAAPDSSRRRRRVCIWCGALMQRMGGHARFDTAPGRDFAAELWFPVSA